MTYQISTAMASFCRDQSPEHAMRMVKNAGFDSLDFPFSVYSNCFQAPMLGEWRLFPGI